MPRLIRKGNLTETVVIEHRARVVKLGDAVDLGDFSTINAARTRARALLVADSAAVFWVCLNDMTVIDAIDRYAELYHHNRRQVQMRMFPMGCAFVIIPAIAISATGFSPFFTIVGVLVVALSILVASAVIWSYSNWFEVSLTFFIWLVLLSLVLGEVHRKNQLPQLRVKTHNNQFSKSP